MVLAIHRFPTFLVFLAGFLIANQTVAAGVTAAARFAFFFTGRCRYFAFITGAGQSVATFPVGITITIQRRAASRCGSAMMRAAIAVR